mgnify:CR=1 FL=1
MTRFAALLDHRQSRAQRALRIAGDLTRRTRSQPASQDTGDIRLWQCGAPGGRAPRVHALGPLLLVGELALTDMAGDWLGGRLSGRIKLANADENGLFEARANFAVTGAADPRHVQKTRRPRGREVAQSYGAARQRHRPSARQDGNRHVLRLRLGRCGCCPVHQGAPSLSPPIWRAGRFQQWRPDLPHRLRKTQR